MSAEETPEPRPIAVRREVEESTAAIRGVIYALLMCVPFSGLVTVAVLRLMA